MKFAKLIHFINEKEKKIITEDAINISGVLTLKTEIFLTYFLHEYLSHAIHNYSKYVQKP